MKKPSARFRSSDKAKPGGRKAPPPRPAKTGAPGGPRFADKFQPPPTEAPRVIPQEEQDARADAMGMRHDDFTVRRARMK